MNTDEINEIKLEIKKISNLLELILSEILIYYILQNGQRLSYIIK